MSAHRGEWMFMREGWPDHGIGAEIGGPADTRMPTFRRADTRLRAERSVQHDPHQVQLWLIGIIATCFTETCHYNAGGRRAFADACRH